MDHDGLPVEVTFKPVDENLSDTGVGVDPHKAATQFHFDVILDDETDAGVNTDWQFAGMLEVGSRHLVRPTIASDDLTLEAYS